MRVFALCFRLLLVLTLLANSVGSASAMARMGMGLGTPGPEGSAAPATTHTSCHEAPAAEPTPDQPAAPAQPQDCCDGSACACPCVGGLGHMVATPPAVPAAARPNSLHVDAASSPHRSPALPHLLRPPIGQA